MNQVKVYILLVASWLLGDAIIAQDYSADMKKTEAWVQQAEQLQFSIRVEVFDSGQRDDSFRLSFKKDGTTYWYDLGEEVFFYADQLTLHADRNDRQISVMEAPDGQPFTRAQADPLATTQLLKLLDGDLSYEYLGLKNGAKRYRIHLPNTPIHTAIVDLDPNTYFYRRIEYLYDATSFGQGYRTVLNFYNVKDQLSGNLSADLIAAKVNGQYVPQQQFQGYKIQIVEP